MARYAELAALLTGGREDTPEAAIAWITALCADLRVPGLTAYGVTRGDLTAIAEKAAVASSMKANPIVLTTGEFREILEDAL